MIRIAVMLPHRYRGGSLRAAKNIAKSITLGSQKKNIPVQVCFSYVKGGNYDHFKDFSDLIEMGITLRETEWNVISRKNLTSLIATGQLKEEGLISEEYTYPSDGASDFYDCDLWIIISDRSLIPILPIKKYLIFIYDYIQRYVPEIFETPEDWNIQERSYFITTRSAAGIFVTTPNTRGDLISYCGVNKEKIQLINMDYSPLSELTDQIDKNNQGSYFIWPTNTTQHKNHLRTLEGIEEYFEDHNALECYMIGTNTNYFLTDQNQGRDTYLYKHPYIKKIREYINSSSLLKSRLHILGEVPDLMYMEKIKNAAFLLHSCLYDNGTFCVLDAAYLGRPSLSAKYPAIEYMNEHFNLNLQYFNPYDSKDLTKQLKFMHVKYHNLNLPPKESFKKFTWESNSVSLFNIIETYLS